MAGYGTTKEYREQLNRHEKDKADMKERMRLRRSQTNRENVAKRWGGHALKEKPKGVSGQLKLVEKQILEKLLEEIKGAPLVKIDIGSAPTLQLRKQQVDIWTKTLSFCKQLKDYYNTAGDEEGAVEDVEKKQDENLKLIVNIQEEIAKRAKAQEG